MSNAYYEGSYVVNPLAVSPQDVESVLHESAKPSVVIVTGQESLDWQINAACKEFDPELFFSADGERKNSKVQLRRIEAAKRICSTCPVLSECMDYALKTEEPYGIWGGLTEDERSARLGLSAVSWPRVRPTRIRLK